MENVRNTFQSNEKSNYELYSIYLQNPYNFDKHWKICHENKKKYSQKFLISLKLSVFVLFTIKEKVNGT